MAVTDEAISAIKGMIVAGDLVPGQRLPPENDLAEQLGLSRNSLREAIKSLEVIRVLDVRRGDGTYVTSLEPRLLLEVLSFVTELHQDATVVEVFEVRRVLEGHVAREAARRITPETLDALASELASIEPPTPVEDLVAHDLRFHRILASASGNDYLSSLLEGMSGETTRARVWRALTEAGAAERTLTEHRAILDALRARDADLAHAAVTLHIAGIETWVRQALTG